MSRRPSQPYFIGIDGGASEVTDEMVGSKAAQLWHMSRLGLDVPAAFVMPTTLCAAVNARQKEAMQALDHGLRAGIARLEEATGRRFGDRRAPLLVSVRSGAARSMPGMLDTILNVGLNDETVHGLIRTTGNPRLGWDSFRRLIQGYAGVVGGVAAAAFQQRIDHAIRAEGAASEAELDPEALERLTEEFRDLARQASGRAIPDDPMEQLAGAARAVYRSWESPRAVEYRRLNGLDGLAGTAVTVQAMVFGNAGATSGAGVAFSRNPATGEKELYVDFLFDAQGEDVVSGRRNSADAALMAARLPQVARQLADGAQTLERAFRDVQDIEFTVEAGKLYFLQARAAKRTPRAALRSAVDFVREGLITPKIALARLAEINLERAGSARFAGTATAIAQATSASPGVTSGRVAFDSARAKALAGSGAPVILVRPETSTEDVAGFVVAAGILTAVGGRTAHAAVVARQLGKVCLVGCRALDVTPDGGEGRIGDERLREGDWLSLDGNSGEVFLGRREIVTQPPATELAEVERWRAELAPKRA